MRSCRTRCGWLAVALVLVGLMLAGGGATAAFTWQITTVDSGGSVGWYTSLALDSSNHPHISYYDSTNEDLKYASWDDSGWQTTTVDSDGTVGWDTSLALDSSDLPHISYYDATKEDLKYASWDDSGWQTTTVDSDGIVGRSTSLALDPSGHPHISYYDSFNGHLKYASWDDSGWQIDIVDSDGGVGLDTSLALDSSGHPHISYLDGTNGDLKYASWDDSGWHITTVDSDGDVGRYTSLALDSNDDPHISYYDGTHRDLKYASWDDSGWQTTTVDSDGDVGTHTSLALDSNNHPHISYYDLSNMDLKYASWDGSSWQTTTVDNVGLVELVTSLALDSSDLPHISYLDVSNLDLKYASLVEDSTAPSTTALATTADQQHYTFDSWTNQSVSVTLAADDGDGSGVATIFYTLNDGTPQTYSNTPIEITAEGTTTLAFWSIDKSGNEEVPHQSVTIMIDRTPPTITYTGNAGTYPVDQTILIHCQADDNLSGIATTDCHDISGPAASFGLGPHTLTHTATDQAGNAGHNTVSFTVTVTADSLCALTQQEETNPLLARFMCLPLRLGTIGEQLLHNPRLKQAGIRSYVVLVNLERGRGLTWDEADTLIQLAFALE